MTKPNNPTPNVSQTKIKPNKLDTLIDLIGEIEETTRLIGKFKSISIHNNLDRKLAKAKSKAFKIIDLIRNGK